MEAEKTIRSRLFLGEVIFANVILSIQFIIGMFNNFYVDFPTGGPLDYWRFVLHSVSEMAHIFFALLILVGNLSLLARAIKGKYRHWIRVGSISVPGALLAVAGGILFVTTQIDAYSYVMAVGFLTTLLALNWGLYTQ